MATSKRLFSVQVPHGPGGVFFSWQRTSGGYLATTGYDQIVNIYNRHAEIVDQIRLPGMCVCFGWDKDGDLLAAITDKSANLLIWDSHTRRSQWFDSSIRDPLNVLVWSKTGPHLAIGSYRGNLMLYNHRTSRKVPVLGKHSKAITCGAWSESNLLALGSDDRTMSISNMEGDTIRVATLRAEPSDIQFSEMKQDEKTTFPGGGKENTVSAIVGGKTLYLFNLYDPDNPIELAFQNRYGTIQAYHWFGDGYILLGFDAGYFVVISTHMREIGQELFQVKNHKETLTSIAISKTIGKAASCGDNTVKVHELQDLKDTSNVINIDDERGLDKIEWSEDGQLLAVSTTRGNMHVYLSKLPLLGSSCNSRVAYLTSLLEVTVTGVLEAESHSMTIVADIEPTFLALGPYHLALGMNNRAWFYLLGDASVEFLKDKEYLGSVQDIHLNGDYCAVRFDGKILLHVIEGEGLDNGIDVAEERESKLFPDPTSRNDVISCHALTPDFLIYGTDMGSLFFFFLEDWTVVHEFRHNAGIKTIVPEPNGTKLIMLDVKACGYVFNPINDELFVIRAFPENVKSVMWDNSVTDKDIFVALDGNNVLHTFIVHPEDVEEGGTSVKCLGQTKVPLGQHPILLFGGEVSLQTQSGKMVKIMLSTHETAPNNNDYSNEEMVQAIRRNVQLNRFSNAWTLCQVLKEEKMMLELATAAMKKLEIELASRIYRHLGDIGMVWSLHEIKDIEDKKLLSGHVAMILGDYNLAQSLYLQSGSPVEALNMRRDLLQWDQALHLADKLAPKEIPYISKEYAQQLEITGSYSEALNHYERGLSVAKRSEDDDSHYVSCKCGVARMSLRCGDLRKGLDICKELKQNRALHRDCAEILESMKQNSEAANLYELSGYHDKAAYLFIKLKNWAKIGQLLPHISSPKIQLQYAKAKEAEGQYRDAVIAYEAAHDFDNAVRIHLDHLNNPESAVKIVKETKSTEGAKLVARFFLRLGDFNSAIQFLILSKCVDEAFQLAKQHGKMDLFADIIGDEASIEDYQSIAVYFESERNSLQAGKFFYKAGQHSKALRHLLKSASSSNDDAEAITLAIEVVGASGQAHLSRQLVDFLMGETDGVPKDAKYLFRLYMAKGQYREAAKTAIIIAREEQSQGNYRNAHDVLFKMHQELVNNGIAIPSEMKHNLMILHSYILARAHVKRGDHLRGARMLLRVAKNISKFPSHVVNILTSTVIECQKAGLKNSAFNYAVVLMRPEHRSEIDEKYKKKIEGIIRKPQKTEEEPLLTPCPYCQNPTQESELHCDSCRNTLPYCIISGYHILCPDLTQCPHCQFPGIRSELLRIAKNNEICPMCSTELSGNLHFPELNPSQIKTIVNATTNGVEEDEEDEEDVKSTTWDENDENHRLSANSSSSNATAGSTSRPASYRG